MSKLKDRNGRHIRGTYLDGELIRSNALRSLTRSALVIYIGLRSRLVAVPKRQKRVYKNEYDFKNERDLIYTYDEMQEEWDISSRSTVTKAIDELIEKGLIDIVRSGMGIHRRPNVYAVSDRWRKWHPSKSTRVYNGFVDKSRERAVSNPGFGALLHKG